MARRLSEGVYDDLLDAALEDAIRALPAGSVAELAEIESADQPRYLADLIRGHALRAFASVRGGDARETSALRAAFASSLVTHMAHQLAALPSATGAGDVVDAAAGSVPPPVRRLQLVAPRDALGHRSIERPEIPLGQSALLVNAPDEPSLASELRRELASANDVDLLCAFVKWSGLQLLLEPLTRLIERGGRVRVITTTYIGASDARAIHELARVGAQVRISFDTRRTRLHAKAWLFRRATELDTAYVGSSNLSKDALHDGLEWNVRLSKRDAEPLLNKFDAAFEAYWASDEFIAYDPAKAEDLERLERSIARERGGAAGAGAPTALFELTPHPYQEAILEALQAEREHGHWRNLVVAPTGTGKTLVAAFDYARLRTSLPSARLLFVAHRERILDQSRVAFQHVLRQTDFGALLVGGQRPASDADHVFASIQSLNRVALEDLAPDRFDVVIVDEFHHAEATTYQRLLDHLRPRVLLGLTATPERADGRDVRRWFDGRTAYEMRLWDALEQGLLCPFHYFGVNDNVSLDTLQWTRTGYDRAALENLYTGHQARTRLILQEVHRRVLDPQAMRALAFCVGVEHARFMAKELDGAGIRSVAVTGDSSADERDAAIAGLERGEIQVLCTVDLFNEGVDIPAVDTVLFLRPTESATVFLQQLGRGLRLHKGKPGLTVLDFIGNARREFRFDRRFRAVLGGTTRSVQRQIEGDFPYLPPGCAMHLDAVARQAVLENIRRGVRSGKRWLTEELRALGADATLRTFLDEAGVDAVELYENKRSFASLRADAFGGDLPDDARKLQARLGALLHVNDDERMRAFRAWMASPPAPEALSTRERRLAHMLTSAFFDRPSDMDAAFAELMTQTRLRDEGAQLLDVLDDARREITLPWSNLRAAPLAVHGRYRQEEILAALDVYRNGTLPRVQGGTFPVDDKLDLVFVTLRKTDKGFSPSTMYRDYAISPTRFHWESPNAWHADTAAARRYIERRTEVLLFVRDVQQQSNGLAMPYVFLGPARLVEGRGGRPMQIVWDLANPMPAWLFQRASLVAG